MYDSNISKIMTALKCMGIYNLLSFDKYMRIRTCRFRKDNEIDTYLNLPTQGLKPQGFKFKAFKMISNRNFGNNFEFKDDLFVYLCKKRQQKWRVDEKVFLWRYFKKDKR